MGGRLAQIKRPLCDPAAARRSCALVGVPANHRYLIVDELDPDHARGSRPLASEARAPVIAGHPERWQA